MTNHMSASEHVSDIISRCAQSIHAIRTLRCHGMSDEAMQVIYKSVVLQKFLYTSSAWWGFTSAADCHRIEAFIRCSVRSGFYSADSPTAAELVSDSDDNLFQNIVNNVNHLLHKLLPERTAHDYNLRQRRHDLTLHVKTDDKNFLSRMLFKDVY